MQGSFTAFLGGTETYGKFIDTPFSALTEVETGMRAINLGCINAGIDVYCNDKSLIDICSKAKVTVVQILGAHNLSNRYYRVHQRRNDRFLSASSSLQGLYPDVDFTEFAFTRHLLQKLDDISHEKFLIVVEELKEAWLSRMRRMLSDIGGRIILLWMADRSPPENPVADPYAQDPMFIDRSLIDNLADVTSAKVEIVSTEIERFHGLEEMYFAEDERAVAAEMLGPLVHRRTASELASVIRRLAPAPKA